jgi:deoxyribonuclease-1
MLTFIRIGAAFVAVALASCDDRSKSAGDGPRDAAGQPRPALSTATARAVPPARPLSFRDAKRFLAKLYATSSGATTIYSGCALRSGEVDWQGCCLAHESARRPHVEWEHVVPASAFGRKLPAWRDGDPRCKKRDRPFRGRRCARRVSRRFNDIEGDMHNLFPEIGDVNQARGDRAMGWVEPSSSRAPNEMAGCQLFLTTDAVTPRAAVRGEVARAYLYMSDVYSDLVVIDDATRALLKQWHEADPPDELERHRNRAIAQEQGNVNPWIEQ